MPRKPTKNQWETLIRHFSVESGSVFFTRHALARMRERHITRLQVLEVLQWGVMRREPEPDINTATLFTSWGGPLLGETLGLWWRWKTPALRPALLSLRY